jgi:hypothetical protein
MAEVQAPTKSIYEKSGKNLWKRFIHWVAIGAPRRDTRQGVRPHRKSRATLAHARAGSGRLANGTPEEVIGQIGSLVNDWVSR